MRYDWSSLHFDFLLLLDPVLQQSGGVNQIGGKRNADYAVDGV
jgi:hypothetical protein